VTEPEIRDRLVAQCSQGAILPEGDDALSATPVEIRVHASYLAEVARVCRGDSELHFDSLMCLSALDRGDALSVVYHLHSMSLRHKAALRVDLPRANPVVETVCGVWRTAEWHEREAYDMLGVRFEGHPDLRRILLPNDWVGYPLRKDYETPTFYRGMKVPY